MKFVVLLQSCVPMTVVTRQSIDKTSQVTRMKVVSSGKCEVCKEEMVYRDHETHRCFMRKEMNEVKSSLTKITGHLEQMQLEVKKHGDYIRHLQDPLRNVTPSSLIFVAGGHNKITEKNFEVFNWSTKKWTLYPDVLFYSHHYSCSVVYKNTMMVCGGGENLSRIERVNIKEDPKTPLSFPVSLPNCGHSSVKGVLNGNRLLTFQDSAVHKVVLESPQSVTKLLANLGKKRFYGVEYVNQNIVIVGGKRNHAESLEKSFWEVVDDVLLFDTSKNTTRKLAPLPYKVSKMATVPYQDNVVILGGEDENNNSLSSVVMYNITTQECKRLPSMLEKRSGCAAVILAGDVIVVIGGFGVSIGCWREELNSIEYLVLGQDSWNELPPMNRAREGATASVQV